MIGQQIGNYIIDKAIGAGGMGEVYLAHHSKIQRLVAIKVLNPSLLKFTEIKERFKNEAVALSSLQHPNIVNLHDFVETESLSCLVMEYVDGVPLDEYIAKVSGPIPEEKTKQILAQVLDAVQYAHAKKVIHRDIKPSNILIKQDGTIKILDFGIAKLLNENSSMTKTGVKLGTILYMSPEQVRGTEADERTDIYAIGITLFQMLTGQSAYPTENVSDYDIYTKILHENLPTMKSIYPSVTDKMQQLVNKATNKLPIQRFQSCHEFKQSLLATTTATSNPINTTTKTAAPVPTTITNKNTKASNKTPINTPISTKKNVPLSTILLLVTSVLLASLGVWYFFIKEKETTIPQAGQKMVVLSTDANLRTTTDSKTDKNIVQKIKQGEFVEIIPTESTNADPAKWTKVKYQDTTGFVFLENLVSEIEYQSVQKAFGTSNIQKAIPVKMKKAIAQYFVANKLENTYFFTAQDKRLSQIMIQPDVNKDSRKDLICLVESADKTSTKILAFLDMEYGTPCMLDKNVNGLQKLKLVKKGSKVEYIADITDKDMFEVRNMKNEGYMYTYNEEGKFTEQKIRIPVKDIPIGEIVDSFGGTILNELDTFLNAPDN